MRVLIIATIQSMGKTIGYRIIDVDDRGSGFKDVPVNSIKSVIEGNLAEVINADVINGEVVGTNGSFDRYPVLNERRVSISMNSPLVIINQIGDVGYTVVDFKGSIKKARNIDVVDYAKRFGIANGKVVSRDNVEFVSSISGSYEVEKVTASRVGNTDALVNISLRTTAAKGSVADHARTDVSFEIGDKDVFKAMNSQQKQVIKDYYTWYTLDRYKSLARSVRFDLAVGKAEKLAELRGITEWEFGGVWDTGFVGASHCTLGHALRYEYYAVPSDDRDNPDARIIFGENCASDFFNISVEDMKKLNQTRVIMSDEIKILADVLANNSQKEYMDKASLLYAILRKVGDRDRIEDIFGEKVGRTLVAFMITKLPFPMSLVIEASKQTAKNPQRFFEMVFGEYREAINMALNRKDTALLFGAGEYLNFIATNKIEGDYAYNPLDDTIKRRDVGNYNKKTRDARSTLLYRIRYNALCSEFKYEELVDLLYCVDYFVTVFNSIKKKFGINRDTEVADRYKNLLMRFAMEAKGDMHESNTRYLLYNAVSALDESLRYRVVSLYYSNERNYQNTHVKIKAVREQIEKHMDNLDNALDTFAARIEEEERMYQKEREERLREAERREAERVMIAELHEAARLKREAERKERERLEEEELNKEEEETDKANILRGYMEKYPDLKVGGRPNIAKGILDTGRLYADMTPNQRYRIDDTISHYEAAIKGVKIPEEEDNKTYTFDEQPEIEANVNRIIDKADSVEMQEVLAKVPLALKIAYTIAKHRRASDKQLKHINKAIELLDKA